MNKIKWNNQFKKTYFMFFDHVQMSVLFFFKYNWTNKCSTLIDLLSIDIKTFIAEECLSFLSEMQ